MTIEKRTLGVTRKRLDPKKARKLNNFNEDGTPISGKETIEAMQERTDTVLMSFSTGKDSIAAWLAIRDKFEHIVPYYLWLVPGLSFVEESLAYYEDFFDTEIIRLPHPSFWRWMNQFLFQPPERCQVIEAAGVPNYDYDRINEMIIKLWDLPRETFVASGVRAADSPMRRSAINQYGPINWKRKYFYPVWDMYKHELIELCNNAGAKLPLDYELFGRSFDGIDYRFLIPLREHRPKDFDLIMDWFPMARFEIMRYEEMS